MTKKLDHESLNRLDKASGQREIPVVIAAAPEMDTFQGKKKEKFKEENRLICPVCEVAVSHSRALKKHIYNVHKKSICHLCGEKYIGLKQANHHVRTIHGDVLKGRKEKKKSAKLKRCSK